MTAFSNTVNPSRIPRGKLKELAASLSGTGRVALVDEQGHRTDLPEDIVHHLEHLFHLLEEQRAVVILPDDESFSPQAAANYLGVSFEHFGELLEQGKVPFQTRGSQRCILLRDLLAYEQQRDRERSSILNHLTGELDAAGVYDSTWQGN